MPEPIVLSIDEVLAHLDQFDAILDARSPSEYAEDHLPGARNTPVLDDAQRAQVGTLYKQVSPFAARRLGAALACRNIDAVIQALPEDLTHQWRPLVYCWRGGQRSGALATVLGRIGWRTTLVQGGYREFRRRVLADLAELPAPFEFQVLAGRTGSGKSSVLAAIREAGAQVLDLEMLAHHRGSVLGGVPGLAQPSQKQFETRLWQALRELDPAQPVWVESESKKVGQVHIPDALIARIRAGQCVTLHASDAVRCELLLAQYRHFTEDPQALEARLQSLLPLHGAARIEQWRASFQAMDWAGFVAAILKDHYDPAYDRSMRRNFPQIETAPRVELCGSTPAHIMAAARDLLALSLDGS
jgi:tRNA 2-selenouridine synthase